MKKKQLQLYSGKLSELTTPATPEQTALGITNELVDHEPFIMTDSVEIQSAIGLNNWNQYRTGFSETKLVIDGIEYASYEELKNFIRYSAGVRIIPSNATIVSASADLDAGQTKFVWSSTSNNLNFNLQLSNIAADDMNTSRQFTYVITNATPVGAGATTHGYINVLFNATVIDIIPRGTTKIYSYGAHDANETIFTSPLLDRNLYTKLESYTTVSNYVLDPSVALVYALNYNISTPSTITVQTSNLSMSFDTFTVLMKNTNATNKLTLSVPVGDFAEARTFEINAGKYREASIVRRNGDIIWEVSGELSNA